MDQGTPMKDRIGNEVISIINSKAEILLKPMLLVYSNNNIEQGKAQLQGWKLLEKYTSNKANIVTVLNSLKIIAGDVIINSAHKQSGKIKSDDNTIVSITAKYVVKRRAALLYVYHMGITLGTPPPTPPIILGAVTNTVNEIKSLLGISSITNLTNLTPQGANAAINSVLTPLKEKITELKDKIADLESQIKDVNEAHKKFEENSQKISEFWSAAVPILVGDNPDHPVVVT